MPHELAESAFANLLESKINIELLMKHNLRIIHMQDVYAVILTTFKGTAGKIQNPSKMDRQIIQCNNAQRLRIVSATGAPTDIDAIARGRWIGVTIDYSVKSGHIRTTVAPTFHSQNNDADAIEARKALLRNGPGEGSKVELP